jgi:hypothetical protein
MKLTVTTIFTLLLFNHGITQTVKDSKHKLLGIFDGRTPCNVLAAYLNEPARPDCIKIKWRLSLFVDSITNEPTRYELIGITYKKDNPRIGNWEIQRGSHTDPEAIVYELKEEGRPTLFFQRGDDNILFFLDKDRKLLVGNRDFSYTLNRIAIK